MKHTPGPWEAVLESDDRGQPVAYYRAIIGLMANGDGHLSVVASDGRRVGNNEIKANAELIAQAPVMRGRIDNAIELLKAGMLDEALRVLEGDP